MDSTLVEQKLGALQSWIVGALAFLLVFVVTMVALMLWQAYRVGENSARLEVVASETHGALCALKQNLVIQQDRLVQFIRDNPNGIPGISRATIDRSRADRKTAIDALSGLDCS